MLSDLSSSKWIKSSQDSLHLEILHPLIGFTLFYVSSSLVHRVSPTLSPTQQQRSKFEVEMTQAAIFSPFFTTVLTLKFALF